MHLRSGVTGVVVAILAAGAIAGAMAGGDWIWLHYLCKPATMIVILMAAAAAAPAVPARYRRAVLAGMLFSLAGDVFLMLPQDLFLPGLASFALAHVCYIAAFWPGANGSSRVACTLVYAVLAGANVSFLLPRIPPPLHAPVLVYVAVLVVMAGLAAARAFVLRRDPALARPARMAAIGAGLFVISDTVLAWDRFSGGVPTPALLILASYFGAQWCIARSVQATEQPAGS